MGGEENEEGKKNLKGGGTKGIQGGYEVGEEKNKKLKGAYSGGGGFLSHWGLGFKV
jgi:hypothetical protein